MRVLVTGTAGFIGNALAQRLLAQGDEVAGVDNLSELTDQKLKEARLAQIVSHPGFLESRFSLASGEKVEALFADFKPERVVNLAAEVGVQNSFTNPQAYIESNVEGFVNLLQGCRNYGVGHLVFASSSSVYGANAKLPFAIGDPVVRPISPYAATKGANELMAHAYSSSFDLPVTGLRFFTVYGPWGRPDMAVFKFADSITHGRPIRLFNFGNIVRDFTYIDDAVNGILMALDAPPAPSAKDAAGSAEMPEGATRFRLYNIASGFPVEIMVVIRELEKNLGAKADIELRPPLPGDMPATYADLTEMKREFGYQPQTSIEAGISKFVSWYKSYCQA